jgi:hypothetical protein
MKRTQGSSSVLVLLVLLLLVFLGVLSIVTSGSNLRLAKKNAETIRAWYRMDAKAERIMSDALSSVRRAHQETEAYVTGRRFLDEGQDVVSSETANALKRKWSDLSSEFEREAFRSELFPKVYAILSERALTALKIDGISIRSSVDWSDPAVFEATAQHAHPGPWLNMVVTDPEKAVSGHLEINAEVLPEALPVAPADEVDDADIEAGQATDSAHEGGGHLMILQWKQVQAPFEYKNEIILWEGIVE